MEESLCQIPRRKMEENESVSGMPLSLFLFPFSPDAGGGPHCQNQDGGSRSALIFRIVLLVERPGTNRMKRISVPDC